VTALTTEYVVERARARTEVEDPAPSHFLENLDAIVTSMNDDAALNPAGVEGMVAMMATALRNRMEVDRFVADVPEVDASVLAPPIFLTGLPRSGTTYFQYLFDQEPTLRMLRTWKATGRRRPRHDPESARRRRAGHRARAAAAATGGKIDAMHLTDVDGRGYSPSPTRRSSTPGCSDDVGVGLLSSRCTPLTSARA
jgi:hypothetical protein